MAQAAQRLQRASDTGQPCPPVRDLIGSDDVVAAYLVQGALGETRVARGARVVGRKIGLTSATVREQLGVDQPDFGVLYDDMRFDETDVIPMARLLQPKVEAEVAFLLGADLADGSLDGGQVRDAVDVAVAALEIVDSRIAGWDITFGDTVADNASSGLFVLGNEPRSLAEFEPAAVVMSMRVNGDEVSTGTGEACLGDPLEALRWLAVTARDLGEPLRAGQIVLSGALGRMAPVLPGDHVTASISGLGTVTARFGQPGSVEEDPS